MKKFSIIIGLFLLAGISIYGTLSISWKAKKDKVKIGFDVVGDVDGGSISGFNGTILFNPTDLSRSSFDVSMDVTTIQTGDSKRDGHLQAEKYFNSEKYPKLTFKSKEIEKGEKEGTFLTTGDLTIKGITKEVIIPFTFEDNTFKGKYKIHRADFGLRKTKGDKEDVIINIEVPVTK